MQRNALNESKRTAARRHWDKIGNVVRLIIERRRNYRFYLMMNQACPLSSEQPEVSASQSTEASVPTRHALDVIGEDELVSFQVAWQF